MEKSTKTCKYVPSIERGATHDLSVMFSKANVSWPKDKMSRLLIDFCCHFAAGETGLGKDIMRTNLCAYFLLPTFISVIAYWSDLTVLCTAATFVQQQVVWN